MKQSDFGGRFLLPNVTGSTQQNQLVLLGLQSHHGPALSSS